MSITEDAQIARKGNFEYPRVTPPNRSPSGIFYGWWIVGAFFMVSFYVAGVAHYGFTALFTPVQQDFGWSYAQISLAASIRGMEAGLLAPLIGLLIDRSGPRRLMLIGILSLGAGFVLLSRTTSLGMFYGAFILIAVGTSTCMGTLPLTTLAKWFRTRISLATGIMACGSGFSGLLVPVIVGLIDTFDWRTATMLMGAAAWVLLLPLVLVIRKEPERYGYLPDGLNLNSIKNASTLPSGLTDEPNITAKQAIKARTFWHLTVAFMCNFIILSAVTTHVMPYLNSVSIDRQTSGLMASGIPLFSIIGRLGSGWLGDRINRKLVMSVNYAALSISLLMFAYVSSEAVWLIIPFLILFSIGYGGNFVMITSLTRHYFGRRWFGTINGFMMGIVVVGSISGPLLAGWAFDTLGSYYIIWVAFAALAVLGLISAATVHPPKLKSPAVP